MESEQSTLLDGSAHGRILRLEEPLSFWGGVDPTTGMVIDTHHPQRGENLAGTILLMPYGRGSSSSSQVLAESLRLRTGPAGIVLNEPDPIITLGALIAGLMYDIECPVLAIGDPEYSLLGSGSEARIEAGRLRAM